MELPCGFSRSAERPLKKHVGNVTSTHKMQAHAQIHTNLQNPSFLLPYELTKYTVSQE